MPNEPLFFLNPPHSWQGAMYWPAGTPGTPSEPPNNNIYPQNKPIFLGRFLRGERPVILSQNSQMYLFFRSPTDSWQGAWYQPSGTRGNLIRARKQLYLPVEQTHFPKLLSKRVKTSDFLSKLPNESFFSSTHLTPGKGPCISKLGTLVLPLEPPNSNIYPQNKPIFLGHILRG